MSSKRLVDELETRFIWKTMEEMGYLAATPGVRELSKWPLYSDLVSASPIQSISSNLTVVENGTEMPVGVDKLVIDIGGVDVGFFAVMGENELTTVKKPEGIEFKHVDPIEAAKRIVPELLQQSELVVLISQLSSQETKHLLQEVPGIDVALYGRNPAWKDRAVMEGATITQQTGMRGQFIGELVLILDPDGQIADWGSRNTPLDEKFPENAEVDAAAKQVQAEGKELMKAQRKQQTSEMEKKLTSEQYLGADKCQRCHEAEHKQWAGTAHAKAFGTLVTEGREADKECIGCHVTGWKEPNGFVDKVASPELENVQCESCHAVGTKHGRGIHAVPVTEETCASCHKGEWGKDFDFASAVAKVNHEAH